MNALFHSCEHSGKVVLQLLIQLETADMNGSMFSESDFIPSQIREWYFSTQIAYGVGFMGNFV